jgi:GNAT superfamily N-acetyltransferase
MTQTTATTQPGLTEALRITRGTAAHWSQIQAWEAGEGWAPGASDGPCLAAQDPDCLYLGKIDGQPVASIAVVNWSDAFATAAVLLVAAEHRGHGIGRAMWEAGICRAADRAIGLDVLPRHAEQFQQAGFRPAHHHIRFGGAVPAPRSGGGTGRPIVSADRVDAAALAAYDASCYPADRPGFVAVWTSAPEHHALACLDSSGAIVGYGVVRPGRGCARIGPLQAEDPADAARLFDTLCAHAAGKGAARLVIDVPDHNPAAAVLAETRGLEPQARTLRMYRGTLRPTADTSIYAPACLFHD